MFLDSRRPVDGRKRSRRDRSSAVSTKAQGYAADANPVYAARSYLHMHIFYSAFHSPILLLSFDGEHLWHNLFLCDAPNNVPRKPFLVYFPVFLLDRPEVARIPVHAYVEKTELSSHLQILVVSPAS